MAKNNSGMELWSGVDEKDFFSTKNVEEVDVAEYDKHHMTLFAANINLWRQIIRLSDSLKPVERRILYAMYKHHMTPGNKVKSSLITGYAMIYHCHGDSYPSLVNMTQDWKKQCPLVEGEGNFGSAASEMYAANRYTKACISKYAMECFFDDYDDDCVEMVFNSSSDLEEPMSLPAKFPNILVNGGMGIAFGNAFRIPTYNINDIIDVCKRVVENPTTANVFMIPDLPSGCQIIDDGHSFKDIIDTGRGTLKMRADANVIEGKNNWIIEFTSLPWMVTLESVADKIVSLGASGALPIKDASDHSYPIKMKNGEIKTQVKYRVVVDKAHDPYNILQKIYSQTELQKSVAVDFKVVLDNLTVRRLNMRDLINSWLDERRSYKRRLFNKKLTRISARIDLLGVLIHLLKADNIEKTVKIIRSSNADEAIAKLMKLAEMTSYQAGKIYEMRLSAFTKDAKKKYEEERERLIREREELLKVIGSEKKIDKIIIDELEDLRKYARPRRSKIIEEETGSRISDTTHTIVITHDKLIKKLGYVEGSSKNFQLGSFKTNDYPVLSTVVKNTSSITLVDSFGRYSTVPVHEIDNTELSNYGHKIYDVAKLSGKIIHCSESYDIDLINIMKKKFGNPYLVTITKNGYAKKTPMEVYVAMKNTKNIRAMKVRDDDSLAVAQILFDNTIVVIYTKRGDFIMLRVQDIAEQTKDSMGLITMRVKDGDEVAGIGIIGSGDSDVFVLSSKGMTKRVPIRLFGSPARRGHSADQGNMMTLDSTDSIAFVSGIDDKSDALVIMRNQVTPLAYDNIPEQTKKAKGKRLINASPSTNIIDVRVSQRT